MSIGRSGLRREGKGARKWDLSERHVWRRVLDKRGGKGCLEFASISIVSAGCGKRKGDLPVEKHAG